MKHLAALALVAILLISESIGSETVYRSRDGNLYCVRDTDSGPTFVLVTIIDLTENDGPTPPPNPPSDKWGLIKASSDGLAKVASYPEKATHAKTLSAYYIGTASAVAAGTIPQDKLKAAITEVNKIALQGRVSDWEPWISQTQNAFKDAPINSNADAAKGLQDIAEGLESGPKEAIDFQQLLKFFIEVILPLILKMIGAR